MYFVFTIELNLLLSCFGLSALYTRIYRDGWQPAGPASLKYGRGQLGSIRVKKSPPSPFPFLLYIYSTYEHNVTDEAWWEFRRLIYCTGKWECHKICWKLFFFMILTPWAPDKQAKYFCWKILFRYSNLSSKIWLSAVLSCAAFFLKLAFKKLSQNVVFFWKSSYKKFLFSFKARWKYCIL